MLGLGSAYGRNTYVKQATQTQKSQGIPLPSEKAAVTAIAKTAAVGRERVNPVEQNVTSGSENSEAQEMAVRSRISPYEEPRLQAQLGHAKSELAQANLLSADESVEKLGEQVECECCRNRKYVDGSHDGSVSYQTPTHISPETSTARVMAHEQEHVVNEQRYAEEAGREVLSQSVSLESSICPECGASYTSGGMTTTVTASKPQSNKFTLSDEDRRAMMQCFGA